MLLFLGPEAREWDNGEQEIFNDDWVCLPDEKWIHCRKHNCPLIRLSSIAGKLGDSLSLNIINEADVGAMELKFKTSCCLKVIKIHRYSCRQHTPHITVLSSLSEDIYPENYYQSQGLGRDSDQSLTPMNVDNFKDLSLILSCSTFIHYSVILRSQIFLSIRDNCASFYISVFVTRL